MAHFAKIGANSKVIQVLTMDNDKMLNADGIEDETVGQQWLEQHNNIFWTTKPYASWVKDIATASWKSPIGDAPALTAEQQSQNEAGTHGWGYDWNESNQSWDLTDRNA